MGTLVSSVQELLSKFEVKSEVKYVAHCDRINKENSITDNLTTATN